jgi:putative holliday junction resolvase
MPESAAPGTPAGILALDFGERRIGVATGDTLTQAARPLGIVAARAGQPDWDALGRLVRDWQPKLAVIGLPYNMDGSPGRLTERARDFAREFATRFAIEVATVDERLSSHEAHDRLREQRRAGTLRRRVRKGDIDALAACVLLEQWLRGR